MIVPRQPSDPAQLAFTGGTTGGLKAAVYTHGGLRAAFVDFRRMVASPGELVSLVALPPTAFGGALLTSRWATRTRLVVLEQFEPRSFLAAIAECEDLAARGVPAEEIEGRDFSALLRAKERPADLLRDEEGPADLLPGEERPADLLRGEERPAEPGPPGDG